MMELKYPKAYYRSPYRQIFNYEIFGDRYCFSFKDRLKKVLESPISHFYKNRFTIWKYFKNYLHNKIKKF